MIHDNSKHAELQHVKDRYMKLESYSLSKSMRHFSSTAEVPDGLFSSTVEAYVSLSHQNVLTSLSQSIHTPSRHSVTVIYW